jgi:transketolase
MQPERQDRETAETRCRVIRRRIVQLSYHARSAHLGSSLSVVEIADAVLAASNLRPGTATAPDRDRVVFSKGHAAMAYYAVLEAWGLLKPDLLDVYLKDGSALWGHVSVTEEVPAIDVSTGSLGHGLALATGFALGYRLRGWEGRTFCILSDGECDEGTVWEAALFAGHHRLDRLVCLVDYNKVQSIGHTAEVLDLEPFLEKWTAFRWHALCVDGHDTMALRQALALPFDGRPRIVLADTVKGKGIPRIENTVASHYHPARPEDLEELPRHA